MTKQLTKSERLVASTRGVAARRGKGDRAYGKVADRDIAAPPAEQRGMFSEKPIAVRTEKGQVVGRAFRRQPYFVTLAKLPADRTQPKGRRLISAEQFKAMRFYRAAWEGSQSSQMRCALDVSVRGIGMSRNDRETIPPGYWEAQRLKDCEKPFGAALRETMRAIILLDQSFAQVAMMRWGSRDRQRIITGTGKQKPRIVNEVVPISKNHSEMVKQEFLEGLDHLVRAAGRHFAIE
ncbi:hypothetical protein [Sphingomonas abietis]|uniref:Uncharacterized protein n=1 Tax=Sphingomonas abietis TaxID=3012344 RepID=A0ABY7NM47_9SPHN|nr:hypothetical protein [Sphingomonas abietis]WBO22307.1 hypothetical protein PBT88_19525 [Sphingomonas abietis]